MAATLAAHRLVDGVVRVTLAQIEAGGERQLACRPGCHHCCKYLIRTSRVEALPIAALLLEPVNAHRLARFHAAYPSWRAAAGPELTEFEALLRRHHGVPTDDDAATLRWYEVAAELQQRQLVCPLLDEDGGCGVYEVRPVVCRGWNVTGTAEHCPPSSGVAPAAIEDPALDEAVRRARLDLMHAGRGLPSPDDAALPTLVARALAERGSTGG